MERREGGITAPVGFQAAGVSAGIKKQGKDVALIYSEAPAHVGAVFTTNVVKAAPVLCTQQKVLRQPMARAVIINSGNANACTGAVGMEHAVQMCETTANGLRLAADEVLVASTGVIGVPLPIEQVCTGIQAASAELGSEAANASAAAEAIMTTDTFVKQVAVSVVIDQKTVTIGGMAKGSGMIHPNMATMLGFITTDAQMEPAALQQLLQATVEDTFNMISVDGDTSTNDTVLVLANGQAGNEPLTVDHAEFPAFRDAFRFVCTFLAKQIVTDGEGASKLLEARVTGAASRADARKLVKAVLNSSLVKTAFFGEDANWGRILAAMGYAGAPFDPAKVSIAFTSDQGHIALMEHGEPIQFDEEAASRILHERDIVIEISLGDGDASATGWGCDLSYDYVRINGDYRT